MLYTRWSKRFDALSSSKLKVDRTEGETPSSAFPTPTAVTFLRVADRLTEEYNEEEERRGCGEREKDKEREGKDIKI